MSSVLSPAARALLEVPPKPCGCFEQSGRCYHALARELPIIFTVPREALWLRDAIAGRALPRGRFL